MDKVTEALLPCPFCDGSAFTTKNALEATWSVGCSACYAHMAFVGITEIEAIAQWNTRAQSADPVTVLQEEVERLRQALQMARVWMRPDASAITVTHIDAVLAALSAPKEGDGLTTNSPE